MAPRSILHDVLSAGVEAGASDWHIREDAPVSVRINGTLEIFDFVTDSEFISQALAEAVPAARRKQLEEIGDADFALEEDGVGRFRANCHRQRNKYALTLRYIKTAIPSLDELNLPPAVLELAESQRGVLFVTGITGAGKSTTLACMIEHMNQNMSRHIITIEDPIEFVFEDHNSVIEQRDVGLDVSSFESALKHVMRQDPDVIVLGEMRDRSTFETALAAAETGHLVLCTLHTINAPQTVMRILDMFPEHERESVRKSLAMNLRGIICQRLLRRAAGNGMVPAVEILVNTPMVTKLITEGKIDKLPAAIDAGGSDKMVSFNKCLLDLTNEGLITEEEALLASSNPEQLQMNLKGIFLNADSGGIVGE